MSAKFRAGNDQSSLFENMETLTGQRGDGRNRAVTYGELAELGLANIRRLGGGKVTLTPGNGNGGGASNGGGVQKPTKPTNFKATGGFAYVLLEWDMPNYRGRALTEIYRSPEDNLANAVLIASTAAGVYGDPVDPSWKGYYWIRHVNSLAEPGPYNDSKGTYAETHPDPAAIIEVITEQLNASPLIQKLGEDLQASIKETDKKISDARSELNEAVGDLNNSVDELNHAVGEAKIKINETNDNLSAVIKEEENARIDGDSAITRRVTGLIADFNDTSQTLSGSISELERSTASADQALSERISSMDVAYKKADQTLSGSISELERSTASADQALSERIGSIDAAYKKADQTVTASITALDKTVTDKTQALSQQIAQVESGYKEADTSLTAKVTQESEARSAADTAIGKRVDTVSASLDKNIAAVETHTQALATLDNVKSMWTVKAQAGNITAGIGIVAAKDSSGNTISQVAVAANQFFIYDPNNPNDKTTYAIPFAVSDGKVVIDEAVMRTAVIKILAAQTIVADTVKAGIEIVSPYIKTARIESGGFTVDPLGNATFGQLVSILASGQISIKSNANGRGLNFTNNSFVITDENGINRIEIRA